MSRGGGTVDVTHTRHGSSQVRCRVQGPVAPVGKCKTWALASQSVGTMCGKGKRRAWALNQVAQKVELKSEGQQGNIKTFKWKKTRSRFASHTQNNVLNGKTRGQWGN